MSTPSQKKNAVLRACHAIGGPPQRELLTRDRRTLPALFRHFAMTILYLDGELTMKQVARLFGRADSVSTFHALNSTRYLCKAYPIAQTLYSALREEYVAELNSAGALRPQRDSSGTPLDGDDPAGT